MVIAMDEVLKKMGWDNGFHLPIANVENQALENEIERLMLLKGQTSAKLVAITGKYEYLEKHFAQLAEEQTENQKIIMTEQAYLEEQRTKHKMLSSEKEMLHHEIREMEKEQKNVKKRIESRQNDLTRTINKIEKIKTESAWDAEALAAWDEALSKRQIDIEMIKKFTKEDEKRTLELEAKRIQLQNEYNQKRGSIHVMASEITHHELVLERTSKFYKQLKTERAALIRQWQDSVDNLRQRDADIHRTRKNINRLSEAIDFKAFNLQDQNEYLENEKQNNKELEDEIANLNSRASRLRKHNMVLIETVQTYVSEAETLKKSLTSAAQNLENLRAQKRKIIKDLNDKQKELEKLIKNNATLKKKLKDISNNSASAAERANQLENMIKNLQKEKDVLVLDSESSQNILFRQQQILCDLKNKASEVTMKISGIEISSNLLRKKISELNSDIARQNEVIYDLDYRLSFLQTKIMNVNAENSDFDKEAQDEKISKLVALLDELNEVKRVLDKQIQCIEDEMRRLTLGMTADKDLLVCLKDKLQHELLLCEGGQKQVSVVKQKCQQRQVEENILHLRVDQMNKSLKKKGTAIFTLTKCKLELAMALRGREIEIAAQKDILLVQKRNLDEEKGRLKMDMMSRLNRIEQFKTRYCVIINSLGKSEDGKLFTVTDFKIKMAQEKALLQQEGDELDKKIKTAEKEIRAMENTLKIVNMTNDTYKQSLSTVDEHSDDTEEMAKLEQELSDKTLELYKQKDAQNQYKKIISDKIQLMKDVSNRHIQIQEILQSNEMELNELRKDALEREEKIARAQHQLRKLIRTYPDSDKLPKMDTTVRTLQDLNRNILQQLTEMAAGYLDVAPLITRYFKEQQIVVPSISRLYLLPSPTASDKSYRSSSSSVSEISTPSSSNGSAKSIPSVTISFETGKLKEATSKTSQEKIAMKGKRSHLKQSKIARKDSK